MCIYRISFLRSSAAGHLHRFQHLAVVSKAAVDTGGQTSVHGRAFHCFRGIPGSGIPGSSSRSLFNRWRHCHPVCYSGRTVCFRQRTEFRFLHTHTHASSVLFFIFVKNKSHPNEWLKIRERGREHEGPRRTFWKKSLRGNGINHSVICGKCSRAVLSNKRN